MRINNERNSLSSLNDKSKNYKKKPLVSTIQEIFKPNAPENIILNGKKVTSLTVVFEPMFPKSTTIYNIQIFDDEKIIGSISFNLQQNYKKNEQEYLYISDIQNNTKNSTITYTKVGEALFLMARDFSKHLGFKGRLALDSFETSKGFFKKMNGVEKNKPAHESDPLTRFIFEA